MHNLLCGQRRATFRGWSYCRWLLTVACEHKDHTPPGCTRAAHWPHGHFATSLIITEPIVRELKLEPATIDFAFLSALCSRPQWRAARGRRAGAVGRHGHDRRVSVHLSTIAHAPLLERPCVVARPIRSCFVLTDLHHNTLGCATGAWQRQRVGCHRSVHAAHTPSDIPTHASDHVHSHLSSAPRAAHHASLINVHTQTHIHNVRWSPCPHDSHCVRSNTTTTTLVT